LVLIDGLDEIESEFRVAVERDLVSLGRQLRSGRLIVSCRSADFPDRLEGFGEAEIVPLDQDQIVEVAEAILGSSEADRFFEELTQGSSAGLELANRPLFLAQMVTLFRKRGTIPERPVDLYEAIVRLVISDWDE
jgi:predicted NACHT family NTPase